MGSSLHFFFCFMGFFNLHFSIFAVQAGLSCVSGKLSSAWSQSACFSSSWAVSPACSWSGISSFTIFEGKAVTGIGQQSDTETKSTVCSEEPAHRVGSRAQGIFWCFEVLNWQVNSIHSEAGTSEVSVEAQQWATFANCVSSRLGSAFASNSTCFFPLWVISLDCN